MPTGNTLEQARSLYGTNHTANRETYRLRGQRVEGHEEESLGSEMARITPFARKEGRGRKRIEDT